MDTAPRDLSELRRAADTDPPWLVSLTSSATDGDQLDPAGLAVLDEKPDAIALRVSGLGQRAFEHLVSSYGWRFAAIELWKCPRIEDLTPLEDVAGLRMVSIYWNQRSPRLWNLARTPRLRALRFEDFTRLHQLDDLREGRVLEELAFGDAVWGRSTFASLEPLASLPNLRSLTLRPRRIDDGRIQPLGRLTGLENLLIPFNLFTTEQIAWLSARLPETVESTALAAVLPLGRTLTLNGKARDVLLIGKRKPFLNAELDAARIRRHVELFDEMVSAFRGDPSLEPG